ncbi:MAG: YigZ family protein [Lentisphaeria bacterium]|nr:YigZ family protein [Lentisphaeria bacterium]
MLTLKNSAQAWTQVKNSRFLAEVFTVHSPEEAKEAWRSRKASYDNGGHIVYAFTVGARQNVSGCSDDGEPSGTAGRPVLAVLHGSGLADAMITVARWFGGTKLGTGGLVHAYGDAARAVLAVAEFVEYAPMCEAAFAVPYGQYAVCRKFLESVGFSFDEENFSETVSLRGRLRRDDRPLLENFLRDLGSGGIVCAFRDV